MIDIRDTSEEKKENYCRLTPACLGCLDVCARTSVGAIGHMLVRDPISIKRHIASYTAAPTPVSHRPTGRRVGCGLALVARFG